jgi:hypothetical protein
MKPRIDLSTALFPCALGNYNRPTLVAASNPVAFKSRKRIAALRLQTIARQSTVDLRVRHTLVPANFGSRVRFPQSFKVSAILPDRSERVSFRVMAPEIVDLISSDEEVSQIKPPARLPKVFRPPGRREEDQTRPGAAPSSRAMPREDRHIESGSKTTRSQSPGLFVSLSLPASTAKKDIKGKQRTLPVPEVDLSLDIEDNDSITTSFEGGWERTGGDLSSERQTHAGLATTDNGELSDDEALKQAIALSLREAVPKVGETEVDNAGSSSSSSSPVQNVSRSGSKAVSTAQQQPKSVAKVSLPDQASSPSERNHNEANFTELANPQATSPSQCNFYKKQRAAETSSVHETVPAPATIVSKTPRNSVTGAFSLVGLDRKAMEVERLARLKRKNPPSEAQDAPAAKLSKVVAGDGRRDRTISPPPVKRDPQINNAIKEHEIPAGSAPSSTVSTTSSAAQQTGKVSTFPPSADSSKNIVDLDDLSPTSPPIYPSGMALQTHVLGFSLTRTISFPQLISPSGHLSSALLSSFIWNFDWLFPHFETRRTKFQLVMHAKYPSARENLKKDFHGVPNVRLTFPPMDGNVNCMHSKLMLLFYEGEDSRNYLGQEWRATNGQRLRIVVPTANLVDFDWGVGGYMENTVWLIDLPLKMATSSSTEPQFQQALKQFLQAQTVPNDVLAKLDTFDFSRTAEYGFVHTIGGAHNGQAWRQTGVCGLGRTITQMGLATKLPIELDFVTSSVGSLNDEFMSSIYFGAQGDDGLTELKRRSSNKAPMNPKSDPHNPHSHWKQNFRLYFPSDDTVRSSKGGARKAGTICFSQKWWDNTKFPQANMLDCVSKRTGLLMHNKVCEQPLDPFGDVSRVDGKSTDFDMRDSFFSPDTQVLKVTRLDGCTSELQIYLKVPGE